MKKDSFKKKLASYSAMATAILATPKKSDAQIIYTDVNPDFHTHDGFFNLDLNNDGIFDFKLEASGFWFSSSYNSSFTSWYYQKLSVERLGNNEVVVDTLQLPKALLQSEVISSGNNWGTYQTLFLSSHDSFNGNSGSTTKGNWNTPSDKYLGLNFKVGLENYYGWARVAVINGTLYLRDYAYYNSPDHHVNAGETSCEPPLAETIGSPDSVCAGEQIILQVIGSQPNSVLWYKNGIQVSSSVQYAASLPGNYYAVVQTTNCPEDTTNTIQLSLNPLPVTPTITRQNDTLTTGYFSNLHYQWFYGTYPIPNSDFNFIIPQWVGDYHVIVTNQNGCSRSSLSFQYIPEGVNSLSENIVFTTEQSQLRFIHLPNELLNSEIKIFDASGRILIAEKLNSSSEQIQLNNFSSGIYFFEIKKDDYVVRKKFVVE